jgi:hypothetical protein
LKLLERGNTARLSTLLTPGMNVWPIVNRAAGTMGRRMVPDLQR